MNLTPTTLTGIDSLIHAAGHPHPAAMAHASVADLSALRDDVREAILAIYCDHDEQATRRVAHARWLVKGGGDSDLSHGLRLEEAAFHLQRHQPWEALDALRHTGDALLLRQVHQGGAS